MINNESQTSREWWVERWLELLDSYRFKKRLERARVYARQGNVLSIEFRNAEVLAKVQGTDPEPYQVSLSLDPFTDEDWDYVIKTMSQRAIFSAKLLAGEMPQNIEEVFTSNGLSLFPFRLDNIRSRCSCPDKANPCKHIGAIYYLLGDRFSEDPFVLFQLRGRTKEQILTELRQLRGTDSNETDTAEFPLQTPKSKIYQPPNLGRFWQYNEQLESGLVAIAGAPSSETVLDVLGEIPLKPTATAQAAMQSLDTVYKNVSQQAILAALNRGD